MTFSLQHDEIVKLLNEIIMYWSSIFWFLSWPALVIISYQLIKFTILKYEEILEKPVKKAVPEK